MGEPVVVQGVAVSNNASSNNNNSSSGGAGQRQETRCRDPIFAVLFYVVVLAITAVASIYGPDAVNTNTETEYGGYIIATVIVTMISFVGSALGMAILMMIPEFLIKASLIFVVVAMGLATLMAFASGALGGAILTLIFFLFTLCYVRAVWSRIPFATANLLTACKAIRSNLGVVGYAYLLTAVAGLWAIIWTTAFVGIYDETRQCNEDNVCSDVGMGKMFLLFVSFFFVQQVLQYSIHTTVAGMMGHWWFIPDEASSCCSTAINSAFLRTVTTSFGSICFGSLIVAILQALRAMAEQARSQDDGILLCLAECILGCLASIMEYFNKWAFVYVGLYGYSYIEAGKNVFTLFRNRGWEAIIADDLVSNVLGLMSVVVGLLMGAIAVVIDVSTGLFDEAGGDSKVVAFFLGFLVGLLVTSVLMSTIGSGVNAVIVLFAEAPTEFQQNHAELSNRMREAWSEVYPGSI